MDFNAKRAYAALFKAYGPQGWWPLLSFAGTNPTKTGATKGYHLRDYSIPRNEGEQFEICVGAILTQNTSWVQVEKALLSLKKAKARNPNAILKMPQAQLAEAIKPAGYFNQKAKKLKIFAEFYLFLNGRTPSREELLALWGVGPETADSMLLYAFKVPTFVVDAYTQRILLRMGVVREKASYGEVKALFERQIPANLEVYQEFHALLVEHAKRHCTSRNWACKGCGIGKSCEFFKKAKNK